jgi:hypothetical protein
VALYGDFGEYRLARSYQRALVSLGCDVVPIDTRDISDYLAFWLRDRVLHRITIRSRIWRQLGAASWNRHITQRLRDSVPDLFLVLNGDLVTPDTVLQARSVGTNVFVFHADNPLPPWAGNRPETLPVALACDVYFIWSRYLAERLSDMGVARVEYLPFAWDPVVFPHLGSSAAPTHRIVFVGGWDREREAWLTPIAERFDLKIWGPPYWSTRTKRGSPLRRCWQGSAVEGPRAAQILADSAIALNPLRRQNLPDGVNMRTFEVPGCGGFALATRTAGAQVIFPEGSEGAYFGDLEECCEQIERFLASSTERLELAEMAHIRVAEDHLYLHRVQTILDVFASA